MTTFRDALHKLDGRTKVALNISGSEKELICDLVSVGGDHIVVNPLGINQTRPGHELNIQISHIVWFRVQDV